MKKVFTSDSEIAHLWAHRKQEDARNPRNTFYFEGSTIYSYGRHFPIARIDDSGVVIFTTRTYSPTTAKHISIVRSASSHMDKIFCSYIPYGKTDTYEHQRNISEWLARVESNIGKKAKARKKEMYADAARSAIDEMNKYLEYFSLNLTKEQKKIVALTSTEDLLALSEERRKERERKNKEIRTKGKKAYDKYVALWRDCVQPEAIREMMTDRERNLAEAYLKTLGYSNDVRLRLFTTASGEQFVESSKDVKSEIVEVDRFFHKMYMPLFRKYNEERKPFEAELLRKVAISGGCGVECMQLGGYEVNGFDSRFTLIAGCHHIPVSEVAMIAEKAGWTEEAKELNKLVAEFNKIIKTA